MSKEHEKVKPYLRTHQLLPENQETPIHFIRDWITPPQYFYRRNHFPYPEMDGSPFFLHVEGRVEQPIIFRSKDLLSMPSKTLTVPLECSGNKRALFEPKVYGHQWEAGALSQGVWKGVPLHHILRIVGIKPTVKEVVFTGADFGPRSDSDECVPFSRSLPLKKALHPDTLIAYEWNGKPLPFKHGYPLRLIVPQWYAMASVKWLHKITLVDVPFEGPFQTMDYVYYPEKESDIGKRPVTTIRVNSIIQQPLPYDTLNAGLHSIRGLAWTGKGKIMKIEVSTDNGVHWETANLHQDQYSPYSWSLWSHEWKANQKGEYAILSRATDSCGRTQPLEPKWNRKGYGYHAVSKIHVKVE